MWCRLGVQLRASESKLGFRPAAQELAKPGGRNAAFARMATLAYLRQSSQEVLMCYAHVMFGLQPDATVARQGRTLAMLANEHDRRGRPVSTGP